MPSIEELRNFKHPGLNLPRGLQEFKKSQVNNVNNVNKKKAKLSVNNLQLNLPKNKKSVLPKKNTSNSVANMMKPKRQIKKKASMKIKL